jgi:hypothetical protein
VLLALLFFALSYHVIPTLVTVLDSVLLADEP